MPSPIDSPVRSRRPRGDTTRVHRRRREDQLELPASRVVERCARRRLVHARCARRRRVDARCARRRLVDARRPVLRAHLHGGLEHDRVERQQAAAGRRHDQRSSPAPTRHTPIAPVTAIAVTTAALRARLRPRLRPAKRHERPTAALSPAHRLDRHRAPAARPGEHHHAAEHGGRGGGVAPTVAARADEQQEHAEGERRRAERERAGGGRSPSGRRPARAASTGTRLAERAGTRAASVAATVPVATITRRSSDGEVGTRGGPIR